MSRRTYFYCLPVLDEWLLCQKLFSVTFIELTYDSEMKAQLLKANRYKLYCQINLEC